jgi:outer membrane protein, heavy metal efflux system
MTSTRCSILALSAFFCLSFGTVSAQPSGKESFAFRGTVEAVDQASKRITVRNEPLKGWMDTMSMGYTVDNQDVLNRIKVGDLIAAKVYEGDSRLYDVQVVSPANESGAMRLHNLEEMALASNPTMAQVQANMRAAAALTRQAGLYPNPTVGYYGDEIRGGSYGGGEQGAFASQTIVLGGKLGAAKRVGKLQADEIESSAEVQKQRILNNVRTLFYKVLAAQRMVELRRNLLTLAGDAVQTSRQLGNVGQADRPDILQAEVEQQQAIVSLTQAERNLQATWRILAAVIGNPGLPDTNLEGDLEAVPELTYQDSVATTLQNSPELKLARKAVEHAQASLVQERKVPIPDLQVTGTVMQSFEALPTTGRPTGLMGGAQVGVQLPIFNRNQGNIAAAKDEVESANQEVTRVKLRLERDTASLFRDYELARVTVRQYKTEMLPRAEQAYHLYQTNYRQMAGAYPQVLISQRTLFQLEVDYIQALENAWQTALLIQGFGLEDGLAAPGGPAMQK